MHGKCEVQRISSEVQIKSRRYGVRSEVLDQGSEVWSNEQGFRSKDQRVGIIE